MNESREIGIVDTRNIVKTVADEHGYDLSNYALTSLKRRFEKIVLAQNLKNADALISKLKHAPNYFDDFLKDFAVPGTEMFRDPSLWRWLRDNHFNEIMHFESRYKIWLPDCVSGDELFTLCILLKESELLDRVEIIASSIGDSFIEKIKLGTCGLKKVEISVENYKRYNAGGEFSNYYTTNNNEVTRNSELLDNITFSKINIQKDDLPKYVDMIIYRNHFVYCNQTLQDKLTENLMASLKTGGIFIIGNKEVLGRQFLNDFIFINHDESVFKKR